MRFSSLVGPLLFVGLAAIAAVPRWYRIDAQSLWYDEGISAHQLTRTFPEILSASALDTHPPLYYWTLKAWGEVFGPSALSLRSLSATWGVVMVVLTFLIGRRLFGTAVGVVAAVLLAAAPLAVYYSQEVRMYAQVTALGLLAVYAYTRRLDWLYALAGIVTLYSQYLGIAFLAALNLHALIVWRTRTRREWITWLVANAVIGIAFLPWLPTFIAQQSHALNTSPRTALGMAEATLTAYGGGVASGQWLLWGGGLLVALGLLGALVTCFGRERDELENLALITLVWLLPMGLVIALGFRSGLFELRYLVVGLPGLLLLSALGIVRVAHWRVLVPALAGIALVPAYLGLSAQYFDPSLARDDYRDLVADIVQEAQPNDAIVLVAPNQTEIFNYYYHGALPTIGLPAQRPLDVNDTLARLDAIKARYDRVWLVSWAMNEADPRGVIPDWLATNGFQASHAWYGSVQLALIGFANGETTVKVDAALDNGIVLDAYRIGSRDLQPGGTLDLTLVWRAAGGPTLDRWKVFTHLLDANSQVVAQRDAEPADNLRPTTGWQKGEQVEDNYGIAIPADLPPGNYTLEIGMYDGDRRSVFDGKTDHLLLGQVQVTSDAGVSAGGGQR